MASASTGANPIWKFFVKVSPGQEAQCLKCHSILKTPTGTTTTLATHLKRHPDVFVAYEKERCARKSVKSTAKPDVQQPSVADRFKPKLKHTAPKAQQMTKAIAGFIVRGMHSYSVVEEPGFVAVMNAAMPEYVVPSWTTFSRAIIPELYASKKQNLMNSLQALNALEVVQDVPTRWNSERQMMTRLLKLRKPITVELSECDAVDNLTAAEWKLMTAAVKVLDPLAQATTELSGDKYPTLSQVIPLLECTGIVLARHTAQSDESSAIASSLARSIKARFPGVKTSEDTALAMLLDPKFKDACYTERAEKKWACAILTKAAEGTLQVLGCEASTESDTGSDSSQDASVWGAFASIASDGSKITGPSIKDDVQNYLRAPLLPRCEDPLD
ncbi:hypothetical protein HPB50_013722 [Hyalomma asiaticum]|uniref:Uncharacterized protein n=1 Tax=Hyalomma asiaticum TaxID=266040 RepID=A0ACB7TI57_HYAAI|nr:hypothetical protein HPB50_013722 [Hyalomma asiaticum]